MATYRRMLKDDDDNNILPVTGYIDDYSTSEASTGHTWTNGKTIYKKTVNFGSLPNATGKTVAHGVSGMSYLIKFEAMCYDGTTYRILPYSGQGSPTANITVDVSSSSILIYTGVDRSSMTAYVTLYYTK